MKKDALSELPLGIRDSQGNFTADPQGVAELYALEWKREWSGEDAIGFVKETNSFRALGKNMSQKLVCGPATSIYGLKMFAKLVSLSRPERLSVYRIPARQCLGLFGGEIIRQCFVKLAIPTEPFLQLSVLLGKKKEGAELSPSCTKHIASPCAWYQHRSVNGTSSLQVSGTLRSRVTSALRAHVARAVASSWPTGRVNM